MKVDLPLTEELKTEELPAFYAVRDALLLQLDGYWRSPWRFFTSFIARLSASS
jgi:hypothetical protein